MDDPATDPDAVEADDAAAVEADDTDAVEADLGLGRRTAQRFFDDQARGLDRFGAVLVITVASVVLLSLIDLASIENDLLRGSTALVLSLMTGATFVLALRASGVASRYRRFAEVLVVVATVASLVLLVIGMTTDSEVRSFEEYRPGPIWTFIALATPIAVVRRLLLHRRITGQTLAGAVGAYLLIALAGCYVFLTIDAWLDDGFFGRTDTETHEFMYFSLVTITTLGYGDVAAAEQIGRLSSTSLAVIGQVYLVTFVAMVVGLFIQQREDS